MNVKDIDTRELYGNLEAKLDFAAPLAFLIEEASCSNACGQLSDYTQIFHELKNMIAEAKEYCDEINKRDRAVLFNKIRSTKR